MTLADTSSSELPFGQWRQAYQSALLETDDKALFKRIEIAESAILTRKEALAKSSDHHAERQGMEEALATLRRLKRTRLHWQE